MMYCIHGTYVHSIVLNMGQNVVFDILVVRQENLKQFEMFKKKIFTRALIIHLMHLMLEIVRYLRAMCSDFLINN